MGYSYFLINVHHLCSYSTLLLHSPLRQLSRRPKNHLGRSYLWRRPALSQAGFLSYVSPPVFQCYQLSSIEKKIRRTHSLCHAYTSEERIHLLQGQALRFGYIGPDEDPAPKSHEPEENESPVLQGLQHVRRDLTDNEVGHPIRGCPKGNTVRAV